MVTSGVTLQHTWGGFYSGKPGILSWKCCYLCGCACKKKSKFRLSLVYNFDKKRELEEGVHVEAVLVMALSLKELG